MMNEECKALKGQLNSARKRYQESIRIHSDAKKQAELRDAYFNERRNYHKKCRKLEDLTGANKSKICPILDHVTQKNFGKSLI